MPPSGASLLSYPAAIPLSTRSLNRSADLILSRTTTSQQYLAPTKNPNGYCNHGPNGLSCPVGVARTAG